jgi:hypothetical protein
MAWLNRAVRSAGVRHADADRPSVLGDVRYRDPRRIETVKVDLMADFFQLRILCLGCAVRHPVKQIVRRL